MNALTIGPGCLAVMLAALVAVSAQTGSAPFKSGEYLEFKEEYARSVFDHFLYDKMQHPGTIGCVIVYGSKKEAKKRENLAFLHFGYRGAKLNEFVFLRGGRRGAARTELWIVPLGAPLPRPEPEQNQDRRSN